MTPGAEQGDTGHVLCGGIARFGLGLFKKSGERLGIFAPGEKALGLGGGLGTETYGYRGQYHRYNNLFHCRKIVRCHNAKLRTFSHTSNICSRLNPT